jgi:glycosyltransferase involved in cell wall biosynthesis
MSIKLLALSFHFPPSPAARAVQVHRLMKYLKLPTVLIRANNINGITDASIDKPDPRGPLSQKWVDFNPSGFQRMLVHHALRWNIPYIARNPDLYRSWVRPACKAATSCVQDGFAPDAVVTFAVPFSDHICGLHLKKSLGLPWVAHFSDLWVDAFTGRIGSFNLALLARYERMVMENADLLVFVAPEQMELMTAKYSRKVRAKARVLPHVYDPDSRPEKPFEPGPNKILRHLGELYEGRRSPLPMFEAIVELQEKKPALTGKLRLELVGECPREFVEHPILSRLPKGSVRFVERVPHAESLRLMQESDALLLLDFNVERTAWLPSKLLDYLGSGRPIMGITPEGCADRFIRETGGQVCNPADRGAIVGMLERFLSEPSAPSWQSTRALEAYHPANVAGEFKNMLGWLLHK